MKLRQLITLITLLILGCQSSNSQADNQVSSQLANQLEKAYPRYQEKSLVDRRFKHEDVINILRQLPPAFSVRKEGESVEGRDIFRVTWGNGPIKVLFWSQMHGDEPTATAALFDIFKFLKADDEFNYVRSALSNRLSLEFIPMLNPDGAARFSRRNALGIDLNRDALRLATPEAKLLKRVRDEIDAQWGFNLHDQSRYYGSGYPSKKMATLAFLAPAYNFEKDINPVRKNAMAVIGELAEVLQEFIPGGVARYDDSFEPRAFGDNMQKWGTSTILIESGGLVSDREKQYIRQLNFVTLLYALKSIADGKYLDKGIEAYERIPYNKSSNFFDLLLRNVNLKKDGQNFVLDIGYRLREVDLSDYREFYFRASISDMGDLSYHNGYEELDASNLQAAVGTVYPRVLPNYRALQALKPADLVAAGHSYVRLEQMPSKQIMAQLPIQVISPKTKPPGNISIYQNPAFLLRQENQMKYILVNGRLYSDRELTDFVWP